MHVARAGLAMTLVLGLLARAEGVTRVPRGAGEIGLDAHVTHGESEWEIVFVDDGYNFGRSNLKWRDLDGELYGFHAAANLCAWFTVAGAYASGDLDGGPGTDSDLLTSAYYGLDQFLFSESKSDVSGDVELYHLDLRLHLDALPQLADWPARLYLLLGYQRYDEDLRMRQGVQTVINEEPASEPIENLNSTFDFEWNAYRVGVGGVFSLTDELAFQLQAVAMVGVEFDGAGYWNLRSDLQATPPSFYNEGDGGGGADLRASLAWRPHPAVRLEAGFWQITMDIKDGRQRVYLADGTRVEQPVSTAETRRTGGFATAAWLF